MVRSVSERVASLGIEPRTKASESPIISIDLTARLRLPKSAEFARPRVRAIEEVREARRVRDTAQRHRNARGSVLAWT